MKPHQLRVVIEKAELDLKIAALIEFVHNSPIYKTLPAAEVQRLAAQEELMEHYSEILGKRIAAFEVTA